LQSSVSSPLTSSRLKMSSTSSSRGSSPPIIPISAFNTFGNYDLERRLFLSASNSLKIFTIMWLMSSFLKVLVLECSCGGWFALFSVMVRCNAIINRNNRVR
jgi:hypothetical protein